MPDKALAYSLYLRLMKRRYYIILILGVLLLSFNLQGQRANPSSNSSCNIYIPDAFTPNDDNLNERFTIKYGEQCSFKEFNLKIFDRWGRLVYETNTPVASAAWDGTFEGEKLQQGVYLYRLYATYTDPDLNGYKTFSRQGSLVLLR